MKPIRRKITTAFVFFALLFSANTTHAKNEISVKDSKGLEVEDTQLINAGNIYPGWSVSKKIRVKNKSEDDSTDVYFKFKVSQGKKLASQLKIYVIRTSDKSYRVGGSGDRWTLKEANGENLYIDKLKPEESEYYKIKIVFDRDAGNEFQKLASEFDLNFKIKSDVSEDDDNEDEILASQGREGFTGQPPAEEEGVGEVVGQTETQEEAEESIPAEDVSDEGAVMGATSDCSSWPLKYWLILIGLYAVISNFNKKRKDGNRKKEERFRVSWQITCTAAAIVIWYIFDKCRYYPWVPVVIVIIGVISYIYYTKKQQKVTPKNNLPPEISVE